MPYTTFDNNSEAPVVSLSFSASISNIYCYRSNVRFKTLFKPFYYGRFYCEERDE